MKEITDNLVKFDREMSWNHYENLKTKEERMQRLYIEIVNCLGELGELANLVKKCNRDNKWCVEELQEEVADTFVFLLKIAKTVDMDLKEEVLKKIKKNKERFKYLRKEEGKK